MSDTSSVDADFKLGDEVRVRSAWLDRKGDVYTVDVVTLTHVRAYNNDTVLCYRNEKWVHADAVLGDTDAD